MLVNSTLRPRYVEEGARGIFFKDLAPKICWFACSLSLAVTVPEAVVVNRQHQFPAVLCSRPFSSTIDLLPCHGAGLSGCKLQREANPGAGAIAYHNLRG